LAVLIVSSPALTPGGLVRLYSDLGRSIAAHVDTGGALGAVTASAVQTVPGAQYASITRRRNDELSTLAATAEPAQVVDRLQYELDSGPGVDAAQPGEEGVIVCAELGTDPRWPMFGPHAVTATGIHSVLAIRLVLDEDDVECALNIYSCQPDAFADESCTVATVLATHGGSAVGGVIARERSTHLTKALASNREIGMAMGVLMNTLKVPRESAFELLRISSQRSHRKLIDIARDVVDTGSFHLPGH